MNYSHSQELAVDESIVKKRYGGKTQEAYYYGAAAWQQ